MRIARTSRRIGAILLLVALAWSMAGACHAQNFKENPTYGTVTLKAGANANPTVVRVDAGGTIPTKLGGVAAWVANPPDVRLLYTAGNAQLIIRAESESDTTLLVNLPDGKWIANDDGPNTGLNPYLQFNSPQSGQYDIWVGTFNGGKYPPAVLVISEVAKEMAMKANQFAVIEIENRTSKQPVRYQFRWNQNDAWSNSITLNPGRHKPHSLPIASGATPGPQIKFEKGIGVDAGSPVINLEYYTSKSESGGKGYNFVTRSGANTRDYIELLKRTKSEEDAAYKLSTAIMRMLANDFKAGRELATLAIKLDPTSTRAYSIRGRARLFEGDYDGALRDWAQGLRLAPSDAELHVFRAEAFGRKNRFEKVVEEADKALELDPFLAGALSERASAYFAMRNYDLAIADGRKAVKMEPRNWMALNTLGKCYIAKGQNLMAVDFLSQAIAINQNDFEPYAARAQAYKAQGEANKSAQDIQQATRLRTPPGFAVFYPNDVAWRDLDNYALGQLVTSDVLKKFNDLNFEVEPPFTGKAPPNMATDVEELVTAEWVRHRAFKFEAVAGVDRFLRGARLSDAERKAKGMELTWFYGPVTSPVARFRSGDDLGGLRVIGNLKLPDRKELTMIFALSYYPPTGEKVENGSVGMLFDGDNARLQARLHNAGSLEKDFLFQSFGANLQNGQMVMRPGFNLDETTGSMTRETLTPSSLSTRCMHCHNKGFEPSQKLLEELQIQRSKSTEAIAKLEGVKKFIELAYVNGGGRKELKQIEQQMITGGPAAYVPIEDLYRANRQHWLEIYPQYVEMRRNPQRYLTPGVVIDPARMQPRPPGMNMKK